MESGYKLEECRTATKELDFPANLIVEATSRCNLKCPGCPHQRMQRPKAEMGKDLWCKIIDEVAAVSPDTPVWPELMGEFTLLKHYGAKLIEYAVSKGVKICLNTNGNCVGSVIEKIVRAGISEIYFSLDAVHDNTYASIRTGGNLTVAAANVVLASLIRKDEQKIFVQFIPQEKNEDEEEEFIEFWANYDVIVKIKPFLNWGVREIGEDHGPPVERFACPWLMRHGVIDVDGMVIQCDSDFDEKYSPGNVIANTFESIWNGELKHRRERHLAGDFDFEPCRDCIDWKVGRARFYHRGVEIDV